MNLGASVASALLVGCFTDSIPCERVTVHAAAPLPSLRLSRRSSCYWLQTFSCRDNVNRFTGRAFPSVAATPSSLGGDMRSNPTRAVARTGERSARPGARDEADDRINHKRDEFNVNRWHGAPFCGAAAVMRT